MISIIIPVFNKSRYVEMTLNSIQTQTFDNWECIIIDDNSTDASFEVIQNLIKGDFRFKILKNDINRGACYCRNQGLSAANNDYIIFLDADDYLFIDCLKKRLNKFNDKPSADFLVFPTGTFQKKIGDCEMIWNNFLGNHLNRFLAHDIPWVICSVIWKKSFLKNIGGFDELFPRLQDVELHTKALSFTKNYYVFQDSNPDSFYRIDDRRIIDMLKFLQNDIDGKILFIKKMNNKYPNNRFLKGTLFESLSNVLLFYRKDHILQNDFKKLIKKVLSIEYTSKLGNFDFFVLRVYVFLGYYKVYIKGMNKIFKSLLIR